MRIAGKYLFAPVVLLFGLLSIAQTSADSAINSDPDASLAAPVELNDSLKLIVSDAKSGDATAMNEVGSWYYTGTHVLQDYDKAFEWWKKASIKADINAIANLGKCYRYGHGVEKDSVDAVRLYEKSIKCGNHELLLQCAAESKTSPFDAMVAGDCFKNGVGTKKDLHRAASLFGDAADRGSVEGMKEAGLCYLNTKDNEKALKYFEKGATHGNVTCLYWAGKMLMGGMNVPENYEQGVVYLLKAAEAGLPAARTEMGNLYAEGKGVIKNETQSAEWYRQAAQQKYPKGMWAYANALKDGVGIPKSYSDALFWMAEAVPVGYQRAYKKLMAQLDSVGTDPFAYYVKGMKLYLIDENIKEASALFKKVADAGVEEGKIMQALLLASPANSKPDMKKAVKELEKLASSNPEAAYYLGTFYESGNGVGQDMSRAIELYTFAADNGNGEAQSNLGDIYFEGRGVEKDLDKAVSLYLMAEENARLSQKGAVRLADCYENGLGGLPVDKKKAEILRKERRDDKILSLLKATSF